MVTASNPGSMVGGIGEGKQEAPEAQLQQSHKVGKPEARSSTCNDSRQASTITNIRFEATWLVQYAKQQPYNTLSNL